MTNKPILPHSSSSSSSSSISVFTDSSASLQSEADFIKEAVGFVPENFSGLGPTESQAIAKKLGTISVQVERLNALESQLTDLSRFSMSEVLKTSKTLSNISALSTQSLTDIQGRVRGVSVAEASLEKLAEQVNSKVVDIRRLIEDHISGVTRMPVAFVDALKTCDTAQLLTLSAQYKQSLGVVLDKGTNSQTKGILKAGFDAFDAAVRNGQPDVALSQLIEVFQRYKAGDKLEFYTRIVTGLQGILADVSSVRDLRLNDFIDRKEALIKQPPSIPMLNALHQLIRDIEALPPSIPILEIKRGGIQNVINDQIRLAQKTLIDSVLLTRPEFLTVGVGTVSVVLSSDDIVAQMDLSPSLTQLIYTALNTDLQKPFGGIAPFLQLSAGLSTMELPESPTLKALRAYVDITARSQAEFETVKSYVTTFLTTDDHFRNVELLNQLLIGLTKAASVEMAPGIFESLHQSTLESISDLIDTRGMDWPALRGLYIFADNISDKLFDVETRLKPGKAEPSKQVMTRIRETIGTIHKQILDKILASDLMIASIPADDQYGRGRDVGATLNDMLNAVISDPLARLDIILTKFSGLSCARALVGGALQNGLPLDDSFETLPQFLRSVEAAKPIVKRLSEAGLLSFEAILSMGSSPSTTMLLHDLLSEAPSFDLNHPLFEQDVITKQFKLDIGSKYNLDSELTLDETLREAGSAYPILGRFLLNHALVFSAHPVSEIHSKFYMINFITGSFDPNNMADLDQVSQLPTPVVSAIVSMASSVFKVTQGDTSFSSQWALLQNLANLPLSDLSSIQKTILSTTLKKGVATLVDGPLKTAATRFLDLKLTSDLSFSGLFSDEIGLGLQAMILAGTVVDEGAFTGLLAAISAHYGVAPGAMDTVTAFARSQITGGDHVLEQDAIGRLLSVDPATLEQAEKVSVAHQLLNIAQRWFNTGVAKPLVLDHHQLRALGTIISSLSVEDIVREEDDREKTTQGSSFFEVLDRYFLYQVKPKDAEAIAEKQVLERTLLTHNMHITAKINAHSALLKAYQLDWPRSVMTTSVYVNNIKIIDPIDFIDPNWEEVASIVETRLAEELGEGVYFAEIRTHLTEVPNAVWLRARFVHLNQTVPTLLAEPYLTELGEPAHSVFTRLMAGEEVPPIDFSASIKDALRLLLLTTTKTAQYLRLACDQAIVPSGMIANDGLIFILSSQIPNAMAAKSEYRSLRIDTLTDTAVVDKEHTLGIANPMNDTKTWGSLTYTTQTTMSGHDPFLSTAQVTRYEATALKVDRTVVSQKNLGLLRQLAESRGFNGEVEWTDMTTQSGEVDLLLPSGLDADSLEKLANRGSVLIGADRIWMQESAVTVLSPFEIRDMQLGRIQSLLKQGELDEVEARLQSETVRQTIFPSKLIFTSPDRRRAGIEMTDQAGDIESIRAWFDQPFTFEAIYQTPGKTRMAVTIAFGEGPEPELRHIELTPSLVLSLSKTQRLTRLQTEQLTAILADREVVAPVDVLLSSEISSAIEAKDIGALRTVVGRLTVELETARVALTSAHSDMQTATQRYMSHQVTRFNQLLEEVSAGGASTLEDLAALELELNADMALEQRAHLDTLDVLHRELKQTHLARFTGLLDRLADLDKQIILAKSTRNDVLISVLTELKVQYDRQIESLKLMLSGQDTASNRLSLAQRKTDLFKAAVLKKLELKKEMIRTRHKIETSTITFWLSRKYARLEAKFNGQESLPDSSIAAKRTVIERQLLTLRLLLADEVNAGRVKHLQHDIIKKEQELTKLILSQKRTPTCETVMAWSRDITTYVGGPIATTVLSLSEVTAEHAKIDRDYGWGEDFLGRTMARKENWNPFMRYMIQQSGEGRHFISVVESTPIASLMDEDIPPAGLRAKGLYQNLLCNPWIERSYLINSTGSKIEGTEDISSRAAAFATTDAAIEGLSRMLTDGNPAKKAFAFYDNTLLTPTWGITQLFIKDRKILAKHTESIHAAMRVMRSSTTKIVEGGENYRLEMLEKETAYRTLKAQLQLSKTEEISLKQLRSQIVAYRGALNLIKHGYSPKDLETLGEKVAVSNFGVNEGAVGEKRVLGYSLTVGWHKSIYGYTNAAMDHQRRWVLDHFKGINTGLKSFEKNDDALSDHFVENLDNISALVECGQVLDKVWSRNDFARASVGNNQFKAPALLGVISEMLTDSSGKKVSQNRHCMSNKDRSGQVHAYTHFVRNEIRMNKVIHRQKMTGHINELARHKEIVLSPQMMRLLTSPLFSLSDVEALFANLPDGRSESTVKQAVSTLITQKLSLASQALGLSDDLKSAQSFLEPKPSLLKGALSFADSIFDISTKTPVMDTPKAKSASSVFPAIARLGLYDDLPSVEHRLATDSLQTIVNDRDYGDALAQRQRLAQNRRQAIINCGSLAISAKNTGMNGFKVEGGDPYEIYNSGFDRDFVILESIRAMQSGRPIMAVMTQFAGITECAPEQQAMVRNLCFYAGRYLKMRDLASVSRFIEGILKLVEAYKKESVSPQKKVAT